MKYDKMVIILYKKCKSRKGTKKLFIEWFEFWEEKQRRNLCYENIMLKANASKKIFDATFL